MFRSGTKVGRTLYKNGELVGLVDTPELADEIVRALNDGERLRSEVARLRAALEWFADEGHYSDTYRRGAGYVDVHGLGVARRALLGLGDDDEYEDAWSARAALDAKEDPDASG